MISKNQWNKSYRNKLSSALQHINLILLVTKELPVDIHHIPYSEEEEVRKAIEYNLYMLSWKPEWTHDYEYNREGKAIRKRYILMLG